MDWTSERSSAKRTCGANNQSFQLMNFKILTYQLIWTKHFLFVVNINMHTVYIRTIFCTKPVTSFLLFLPPVSEFPLEFSFSAIFSDEVIFPTY